MSKTFENLITLTQVFNGEPGAPGSPGKDGNVFFIKTTQEEIVKTKISEPITGSSGFSFSPEILSFSLTKPQSDTPTELINFKNSFTFGYYVDENYVSLLDSPFLTFYKTEIDAEDNEIQIETESLYFHVQDYVDSLYTSGEENELTDQEKVNNLVFKQWTEEDVVIKFAYLQNDKEAAIKLLACRHGINNDLAKFNVNAFNINAAVQGSYLQFNNNGLTIQAKDSNSGLKLKNARGDEVLWADINGNLTFAGHLQGATGSFTGQLHATSAEFDGGTIGGFTIEQERLVSSNGQIELYGTSGVIVAQEIELGTGAKIQDYIQLGDAYIRNPTDSNNHKFIESQDLIIYDNGTAKFGKIGINGEYSTISGENWSIGNNYANFNNVNISGTIESSVFKTNSVQAAGGAMIFRPSYKAFLIEYDKSSKLAYIQIEEDYCGEPQNQVWIVDNSGSYQQGEVCEYNSEEKILIVECELTQTNIKTIIDLGRPSTNSIEGEVIIGINSGNSSVGDGLIYPCGLTVTSLGAKQPKLFLGDLSKLNNKNYTGHGLYADNVYLNGSLVTQTAEKSYAGINTLTGVLGKPERVGSNKPIILWAGASNLDSIPDAPFQVTEDGYLYATQAKLTGSLIAESNIYGADIYAARLHGWDANGQSGALTIYDTSRGIIFKTEQKDSEIFSIDTSGFKVNGKTFITINDQKTVSFVGESFATTNDSNRLVLATIDGVPTLKHEEGSSNCGFYFKQNLTEFKIGDKQIIEFQDNGTQLNNKLTLQGSGVHIEYKNVVGGYDLYVVEE